MKKLIQVCSVLCLVVAFSFISVKAQSVQRFEANIPFDFNIGSKSYDAGKYVLRVANVPTGKIIYVENDKKDYLQTSLVSVGGEVSKNNSVMRFQKLGTEWVLTSLMTPDRSLNLPLTKSQKQIAKAESGNSKAEAEFISVDVK